MDRRLQYIDGMKLTVEDLTSEQSYLISKIEDSISILCDNGVIDLSNVQIQPDVIWYESTPYDNIKFKIDANININTPNAQNTTLINVKNDYQFYTVFKAYDNIQRIDIKITKYDDIPNSDCYCLITIKELIDPKNPNSKLSTRDIHQIQLRKDNFPMDDDNDVITLDFKHLNNLQGLKLKRGNLYALHIKFINMSNRIEKFRIYHNRLIDSVDSKLYTYYYNNTTQTYNQQILDEESQLIIKNQLYHKIYVSAIKVTSGVILLNGKKIIINEENHRFIPLADNRCYDENGDLVYNYVVAKYKETYVNPVVINDNIIYKNIKDDVEILVLTKSQFESSKRDDLYLIGLVVDTNTLNFNTKLSITKNQNHTRLFYHNWLNLDDNLVPNLVNSIYNNIQNNGLLFYISNVPNYIPVVRNGIVQRHQNNIYDEYGNIIAKAGDPILERVKKAYLILNNNKNKFIEMTSINTFNEKFSDYALIISDRDIPTPGIVVVTTQDISELEQTTTYNYMILTESGNPVFIQDYNKVVEYNNTGNEIISKRLEEYKVKTNKRQKVIVIDKDLELYTEPTTISSSLIENIPIRIKTDIPTPMDATTTEVIMKDTLRELKRSESFIFEGPMSLNDLTTKILTIDNIVKNAYINNHFKILVDLNDGKGPIDITYSGDAPDADKGGNGSAIIINGYLADSLNIIGDFEVKVRGENRRDNTNYSNNYYPYGPAIVNNSNRTFTIIARGKGLGSNAGFEEGESGYIYIDDRKALDINKQPIKFTFNSQINVINIGAVYYLGEKEYLREKNILSTENTNLAPKNTVLINTSISRSGVASEFGQVVFHRDEIPDIYNGKVYILYNKVIINKQNPTYFKLKYDNIGMYDGTYIDNSNYSIQGISVPDAFSLSSSYNLDNLDDNFKSIAIFYDGINIMSENSPIGKKRIVADDGAVLLPNEVAFNPVKGTIKFSNNTQLNIDYTKLVVSYYKLEKKFIYSNNPYNNYNVIYDINTDGRIDLDDLYLFLNSYGSKAGDYNYNILCDFDRNGYVDDNDYIQIVNHFGASVSVQDYYEATNYRVKSILLYDYNNINKQYLIDRVYCKKPDNNNPFGKTVIFLQEQIEPGEYVISFGYRLLPHLGYNYIDINLQNNILIPRYNTIKIFDKFNRKYDIINIENLGQENGLYKNRLYINPLIYGDNEIYISSRWTGDNIIYINKKQIILTRQYEQYRKLYGAYKLDFIEQDIYGRYIKFKINESEGCNDFIYDLTFTIFLYVKDKDGKNDVWTWYDVAPDKDGIITLSYNDNLFLDHRNKGKNRQKVVTSPFGVGENQVTLKLSMYNGDIENDLSNIHVFRNDFNNKYIKKHKHTNEDGGIIDAKNINIEFLRDGYKYNNLQDFIDKLLDIINLQTQQLNAIRRNIEYVWDGDIEDLVWDGENFWDE